MPNVWVPFSDPELFGRICSNCDHGVEKRNPTKPNTLDPGRNHPFWLDAAETLCKGRRISMMDD